VGANEEQITAVVAAATAVLTRKWSNKSEVTFATISAPIRTIEITLRIAEMRGMHLRCGACANMIKNTEHPSVVAHYPGALS
jgi:hypothetical protein